MTQSPCSTSPVSVRRSALVAVLALALCAAQPTLAQGSGPTPPASAIPTTGLVTIESDRQIADNRTGIITALGNVRILYPDRRVVATARQAQYYSREGRVVLSGDVDVVQADGHSIRAEQLVYLVDQDRLEALPASGAQVLTRYTLPPSAAGELR